MAPEVCGNAPLKDSRGANPHPGVCKHLRVAAGEVDRPGGMGAEELEGLRQDQERSGG
jgi:hypothetical protein